MSKAEKTKKFIIEKSAPIFNTKGYAGTSLTDIMEATGLTKGSIYGNFENKDEVAIEVYKYNYNLMQERIINALNTKNTAYEKLIGFTDYYRLHWKRVFERGGCPIQNASVEADDNLPVLKKHVQETIKNWSGGLRSIIIEGQKNGEFYKNIDPKKYAYTIIIILEGGIMLGKIMNDQAILTQALDRINQIIDTEIKK